jgi:hypothetical protein
MEVPAMRNFPIFLAFFLAACGGNGDGVNVSPEPVQHAPQISNLTLSPDNALYMEGDGSVQVTAEFSFADVGQDIETLHIEMSDGTSLTVSIADVANTAAGTLAEAFAVTTADAGVQTVEIWVVDKAGESSNYLSASFSVIQHTPEISNVTLSPSNVPYMKGDGSVVVTVEISFQDTGRDIQTLCARIPGGEALEFDESIATETGTFTEDLTMSTETVGAFDVEFWLVDRAGDSSDHRYAEFRVVADAQSSDWTNRVSGLPHALSEVIWDGDAFIAVGDGGRVLTSADGIAWLAIESGTGADLNDVAFYGSDIFAVGDEIILHSTDHGTSWTVKDRPAEAAFEGVAINASQVVIGGQHMERNTAIVLISEDRGDTWRAVDSWPDEGLHMNDLVYQDGLFVAPTPYFGEAWVTVSSDGKVWNKVAVSDEMSWTSDTIIHDGSQFILPGTDGAVFTSFDGFNWTRLQTPVRDVSYTSAAWNGSKLVIAGGYVSWCGWFWPCGEPLDVPAGISSTDGGMTWDLFDIDDNYQSLGLAWGNGRFVSVGQEPQFEGEGAIYTAD